MTKIYVYCRISHRTQVITRQIENILKIYPKAKIYQEIFTGTAPDRKKWTKLKKIAKTGDTIIFDLVSKMSRNSEEGKNDYLELFEHGINLIFLKEPYINTEVYQEQMKITNNVQVEDIDLNETILKGVREYLKRLVVKQVIIAFNQAKKKYKTLDKEQKREWQ